MKRPKDYPFTISPDFGTIHFIDLIPLHGITGSDISVDTVLAQFFKIETPFVDFLLKIRNVLMRPFGLKGTEKKLATPSYKTPFKVGEKASFFSVESRTQNEIVLAEKDKHLNFRIYNKLIQQPNGSYSFYCSTVVHYNNSFGRTYFFFVRPFHCLILKALRKKAQRKIVNSV